MASSNSASFDIFSSQAFRVFPELQVLKSLVCSRLRGVYSSSRKKTFLIGLLCFQAIFTFLPISASAAVERRPQPQPSADRVDPMGPGDLLENRIDSLAERIDVALAGKRYTDEQNPSSIGVRQFFAWREGGNFENSTDFAVNLRLPNLEKRWQLRFTSYDEQEERTDVRQRRARTRPREREFGAGVQFFKELGNLKVQFQPRLELSGPVGMSYVLRFGSQAGDEKLRLTATLDLFADHQKGTGEFGSLEFHLGLDSRHALILHIDEEYQDQANRFATNEGLTLNRALAEFTVWNVSSNFISVNRPSFHLESLSVSTGISHEFEPERFRGSLSLFLDFNEHSSFKGRSGASLNLELVF